MWSALFGYLGPVDEMDPRFRVNPFDGHPSAALHEATIPYVAQAVLEALARTPASTPATQPAL